jgi:hypothetical protein
MAGRPMDRAPPTTISASAATAPGRPGGRTCGARSSPAHDCGGGRPRGSRGRWRSAPDGRLLADSDRLPDLRDLPDL